MKYCNETGCNVLIPSGQKYCSKHKRVTKRDNSYYDKHKRNKEAKKFYDSTNWQNVRAQSMSRFDGIDVYLYVKDNVIKPAEHVHHIVPREEDKTKQYDLNNLIPLSNKTHSMIEQRYRSGDKQKKETQAELYDCINKFLKMMGRGM